MYADYEYYIRMFCQGEEPIIDASSWAKLATMASKEIDRYTYGRLKHGAAVTEDVKNAVCAVAEVYWTVDSERLSQPVGIKSESVGSYSVSYTEQETFEKAKQDRIRLAIDQWLPRSDPLRYAGVVEC